MRTLDYQIRVLEALDHYLRTLSRYKSEADRLEQVRQQHPDVDIPLSDFTAKTWTELHDSGRLPKSRLGIPFSPRRDGCARPVPNITLKVPTGGGKTYLAVHGVSKILSSYLHRNTGFILWVVPNEAIYRQTLKNLRNREHPYRQVLDRASAQRTKILEKDTPLHVQDVKAHLCVMVLMLQSSNRQNRETLRMFRDRGDVQGFFPSEGSQQQHQKLLQQIPNLDGYLGAMIKDSLGNALRIIRPVVVLDEGQKATSELAYQTLYGFNPSFVLELTATPKDIRATTTREARYANLLVEVMGRELHREEMIKMPLNLDPRQGTDWRATLHAGLELLNKLAGQAQRMQAECGAARYIRPIMLVQVERTGKDQRATGQIHAEDVREWLLRAGLDAAEIAVKTAETNDLNQPENQNLLSHTSRIRVIITKSALQEGWDCPFAYVLCSLAASRNFSAMTQLIGRILRQPQARKTGIPMLDESHVLTHHADTAEVVHAIKDGLEKDGLGDMVLHVAGDSTTKSRTARRVSRRAEFQKVQINLPRVLWTGEGEVRDFDYETDLLPRIDWRDYVPLATIAQIPDYVTEAENRMQRITLSEAEEGEAVLSEALAGVSESVRFDAAHASRIIGDLIPNGFLARTIIARLYDGLIERGFDADRIAKISTLLIERLRIDLEQERISRAEALFRADINAGRIQFRLRVDTKNWRMPTTIEITEPEGAAVMTGREALPLQRSLFAPIYQADLNQKERTVAVLLDSENTLRWWHRNASGTQYGVQGWRRGRVYPDFVFALQRTSGRDKIVVLETKGDHLAGNDDTRYKQALLEVLSEGFASSKTTEIGALELATETEETVHCALILMPDIATELPKLF